MENFTYNVQSRSDNESLAQSEYHCESNFINRNDFTSCDVERVLMEAHESILGSIEPIESCQDGNSFLSPINDILGDICEFNRNYISTNTISTGSQQVFQAVPNALNNLYCNWPITEVSSLAEASTASSNPDNLTSDSGFFNISSGNDGHLTIPEQTVDYPHPDCPYLGADYSSFNQIFQNFDHQQLSLMSTPISSITHNLSNTYNFSDTFLSTIGSLPASTTITPITVEERQLGHRNLSPVQQEVTIEARFVTEKGIKSKYSDCENFAPLLGKTQAQNVSQRNEEGSRNESFLKRKSLPTLESVTHYSPVHTHQQKGLAILNNNQCSQVVGSLPIVSYFQSESNKNICMTSQKAESPPSNKINSTKRIPVLPKSRFNWTAVFPRKHLIHPPEMVIMHPLRTRKLMTHRRATPSGRTLDLSEYFDTSSISIPIIRDRPITDTKNEFRRKQKLNIIPGSENFIFEIQRNDGKDSCFNVSATKREYSNIQRDPYPETELPELEEIFKRKKKSSVLTSTGKKTIVSSAIEEGESQKRNCVNNNVNQLNVQEISTSFDEKISLSITLRQGRSRMSVDQIDTSSEVDSMESEESMTLGGGKSLKCIKCMKLFKTTRSLAIHTKRCATASRVTESETSKNLHQYNVRNNNAKTDINSKSLGAFSTTLESEEEAKKLKIESSNEMKGRPITRSQTKRSSGCIIRSETGIKRFQ